VLARDRRVDHHREAIADLVVGVEAVDDLQADALAHLDEALARPHAPVTVLIRAQAFAVALEQLLDRAQRPVGVECAVTVGDDDDHIPPRDPHPLLQGSYRVREVLDHV